MKNAERLTHRLRNLLTVVQVTADGHAGDDYSLISEASREAAVVLRELERELDDRGPVVPVRVAEEAACRLARPRPPLDPPAEASTRSG